MNPLKKNNGFIILSVVMAGVVLAIAYFAVTRGLANARNVSLIYRDTIIAETYAGELLELFRSMRSDRLKAYFSLNPINEIVPVPALQPYFLCSMVNYLKRAQTPAPESAFLPAQDVLVNEDPIAALPANVLGGTANRYYQIHLVDSTTLNADFTACEFNMNTLPPASMPQATNNSRFHVTVGVSWLVGVKPVGDQKIATNRNVTVNALIP